MFGACYQYDYITANNTLHVYIIVGTPGIVLMSPDQDVAE